MLVGQIFHNIFQSRIQTIGYGTEIFMLQPIPDYVRCLSTGGELHYLPIEKLQLLKTDVVNEMPGAYLPSKILDMVF